MVYTRRICWCTGVVYCVHGLLLIATTALGIGLICAPAVYGMLWWCMKYGAYKVYMVHGFGVWCSGARSKKLNLLYERSFCGTVYKKEEFTFVRDRPACRNTGCRIEHDFYRVCGPVSMTTL
eukprot:9604-Heterococcus_DN1.PRE.14